MEKEIEEVIENALYQYFSTPKGMRLLGKAIKEAVRKTEKEYGPIPWRLWIAFNKIDPNWAK